MASLVKIESRLGKIELVLAEQNAHLKDHLRRTKTLEDKFEMVETHVKRVQGGAKVVAVFGACVASVLSALKWFIR